MIANKETIVFGKTNCPNCVNAKRFLEQNQIKYNYVQIDNDNERQFFYEKMSKELGGSVSSVPQIFLEGKYIGGYQQLVNFINDNKKSESLNFEQDF